MQISHLELRVAFPDDGRDAPHVQILVDGRDSFASVDDHGYIGFDPDSLLSEDAPLLPREARRVAVYTCNCGVAGCGVVAPVIECGTDGIVSWSDFRDFTGVFDGPTVATETRDGTPLGHRTVLFEAEQYEDEVRRATADRGWVSDERTVARLLRDLLFDRERHRIREAGLALGWVATSGRGGWAIELRGRTVLPDPGVPFIQSLARVESAVSGTPTERAEAIHRILATVPVQEWAARFPYR